MKKLLSILLSLTLTLATPLYSYAMIQDSYTNFRYNGTIYSKEIGNVPTDYDTFFVTDSYIYGIKYNESANYTELHQCNLDSTNDKIIAYFPYDANDIKYSNNEIYYTITSNAGEILYSYNLDTSKLTKLITYKGYLSVYDTDKDYIYFNANIYHNYSQKIYKLNKNTLQTTLIFYSQTHYTLSCFVYDTKIYVESEKLYVLDKLTGQIINTYPSDDQFFLGEYKNQAYLCWDKAIYTFNEDGSFKAIPDNPNAPKINDEISYAYSNLYYCENGNIILEYTLFYDDNAKEYHCYNIDSNTWTILYPEN